MQAARSLLGLLLCAASLARADMGLLKQHCGTCHSAEQNTEQAPSFKAISERYKSESEAAQARLAEVIAQGSAGRWGKLAMPPTPRVTALEARKLARWVLDF
ncbi:MAG: c-type cytochrome [Azoarcus sp.]|jgi:cytochrome c|nr:c-type cytochrome [Azoarcus sp.]